MPQGLNDDFSERAVMNTAEMDWTESPAKGVWRKRLELSGPAEAGRVTSLVRYEPGSHFPPHEHPDGEEVLVLDGTFSDDTGDYSVGSYFLNPDGFRHAPGSEDGCLLFVKLRQYPGKRRKHVALRTDEMDWEDGSMEGMRIKTLYAEEGHPERVLLIEAKAGTDFPEHTHDGGEEIFLIRGRLADQFGELTAGSWARYPAGSKHAPRVLEDSLAYVKAGHLPG